MKINDIFDFIFPVTDELTDQSPYRGSKYCTGHNALVTVQILKTKIFLVDNMLRNKVCMYAFACGICVCIYAYLFLD
jgi:hypothetical protein